MFGQVPSEFKGELPYSYSTVKSAFLVYLNVEDLSMSNNPSISASWKRFGKVKNVCFSNGRFFSLI